MADRLLTTRESTQHVVRIQKEDTQSIRHHLRPGTPSIRSCGSYLGKLNVLSAASHTENLPSLMTDW
jgi:hypothetical protein